MKKNILVIILTILVLGLAGYIVYDKVIKQTNSLFLPVYEVTHKSSNNPSLSNNIQSNSIYIKDYKLHHTIQCQYDLCHWYDFNAPSASNKYWVYYDNNSNKQGGYYIYNYLDKKAEYGPYENIAVATDELSTEILEGIYLYSNGKTGFFNLRGLNKMLFEVEYDEIYSSKFQNFFVTITGSDYNLYSFVSNNLTKVEQSYDGVYFPEIGSRRIAIVEKEGKYNVAIISNKYHNNECTITSNDYKNLNVYLDDYFQTYDEYVYFTYSKNGNTFISRSSYQKMSENNSLDIDREFNIKISNTEENLIIEKNSENESELNLYSSSQYGNNYTVNINNKTIKKN